MNHDLKPYPEYKDSDLLWLGEIPEHWEVRRSKYLLREVNARSSDGQEQLLSVSQYTGVTPRRSRDGGGEPDTRAASLVGYKRVAQDDLVVNIMLAWNGSLGVARSAGIVSPAYCVYQFNDHAEPWYYHNLLRLPIYKGRIKVESTGVVESRLRLYSDDLFRIEALVPPKEEQVAIARFVETFSQEVDRLIRAKRRLIELLNERKQAIIQRAITRGLDPNARLKHIGLESIEHIPDHWQTTKLARLTTSIGDGLHGTPEYVEESPYHFINGNNLSKGSIRITSSTQCVSAGEFQKHKITLDESTLLMSINGTIGSLAYYQGESIILGKSAAYINCGKTLSRSYLFFYLQSAAIWNFFRREVTGTTIFNLSLESIRNIPVALPSLPEQLEISSFLGLRTAEFNELINKVNREIDLLREYRIRLIADVVTGKLDVRGVELPSLDEGEAEEDLDTGEGEETEEMTDSDEAANGNEQ